MALWLLCPCLFLPPKTLGLRFVTGQLSLASAFHQTLCPWLRDWTQHGDTLIPAKAHLCGLGPQVPLCPTPTPRKPKGVCGPPPQAGSTQKQVLSIFTWTSDFYKQPLSITSLILVQGSVIQRKYLSIFPTARFLNPPPSRSAFFPCYFESQSWIESQGYKS